MLKTCNEERVNALGVSVLPVYPDKSSPVFGAIVMMWCMGFAVGSGVFVFTTAFGRP